MRRSFTLSAVVLLATVAAPVPGLQAQVPSALKAMNEGIRLAQAGDTAQALVRLDEAVELDPSYAEAHYQRGLLYFSKASPRTFQFEERMVAEKSFQKALELDPGNPEYLVSLGKLLLLQRIRVDSHRVFQRALAEAEEAAPGTLAEIHYQLAGYRETQWLRFRYRYRLPLGVERVSVEHAFADPGYAWDLLEASATWSGQGEEQREAMLYHLNQALAATPGHPGASSKLLAHYYEVGQIDEFMLEARRFARDAPSEPKAYLALGLGLHSLGRDDEAAGAFEYAMELMTPEYKQDFQAVSRLMRKDQAKVFDSLEGSDRAEAVRRFWMATDPLYLTPSNEFWVEYLARMAYADLRFGMPEVHTPGWQTDRGIIWVRYGRPVRQAVFSPNPTDNGDFEAIGRVTTVWSYGPDGPVFVFRQNPGYRRALFAGDFKFYADDYRSVQPSRFSAPSIPALVSMPAQVARFRGQDGQMELEVHAAVPLDSLGSVVEMSQATLDVGFFVVDPGGAEIRRVVESEDVDFRSSGDRWLRSWRSDVPEGQPYLVSVETRDPLSWAAAHHRSRIGAKSFPAGQPSASDLLLVKDLRVEVDRPTSRDQIRMTPEPTMAFEKEEPVGVYFELYNFLPDDEQFASYELELLVHVEEIYRRGPLNSVVGDVADAFGLTDEGQQAVQVRFSKEDRVVARDMIPEYFTIQMDDPSPGRYGLTLNVLDRNAGREFTIEREFEILPDWR